MIKLKLHVKFSCKNHTTCEWMPFLESFVNMVAGFTHQELIAAILKDRHLENDDIEKVKLKSVNLLYAYCETGDVQLFVNPTFIEKRDKAGDNLRTVCNLPFNFSTDDIVKSILDIHEKKYTPINFMFEAVNVLHLETK